MANKSYIIDTDITEMETIAEFYSRTKTKNVTRISQTFEKKSSKSIESFQNTQLQTKIIIFIIYSPVQAWAWKKLASDKKSYLVKSVKFFHVMRHEMLYKLDQFYYSYIFISKTNISKQLTSPNDHGLAMGWPVDLLGRHLPGGN